MIKRAIIYQAFGGNKYFSVGGYRSVSKASNMSLANGFVHDIASVMFSYVYNEFSSLFFPEVFSGLSSEAS